MAMFNQHKKTANIQVDDLQQAINKAESISYIDEMGNMIFFSKTVSLKMILVEYAFCVIHSAITQIV
jgi:nucleoside-triphosphatase THEP1